jgi:hypothetical protein
VAVVLAHEELRLLLAGEGSGELGQRGLDLGRLRLRALLLDQLRQGDQVTGLTQQRLDWLQLSPATRDVDQQLLRGLRVAPDVRRGRALLLLLQLRLAPGKVKDDPSVLALD